MLETFISGLFAAVGGGIGGGVVGLIIGFLTEPPPDPNDFVDAQGIHVATFAVFGVGIGVVVALAATILWVIARRSERRKPATSSGFSDRGAEI